MKKLELPAGYNLDLLKTSAISAMDHARPKRSELKVGCALYDTKRNIFTGGNIEVLWQRCYHAEESCIISAMSHDAGKIRAICVACDRELFTPCGHCRDLITEFSADDVLIMHVNPRTGKTSSFTIDELLPHYPTHK